MCSIQSPAFWFRESMLAGQSSPVPRVALSGDAVLDGFEAVVEPGHQGDDAGDGVVFAGTAGEVKRFP